MQDAVVIWQVCDGKAGHDNQSTGLVEALSTIRNTETRRIEAYSSLRALRAAAIRRVPGAGGYPDPDLIIGAGGRTHLTMLAARRARGGRAVVLMKPDLPLSWFDLCIIPRHDSPPDRENVLISQGALTRPLPQRDKNPRAGLILLGGPSRHFAWDDRQVSSQIAGIVAQEPARDWVLVPSRRTPDGFTHHLAADYPVAAQAVSVVTERGDDRLPEKLAVASTVWVTTDSVSMVYEALSAGAMTGLIELPARGASRIADGVEDLRGEGRVVTFSDWRAGRRMEVVEPLLQESMRCAREIANRWLSDR